MWMVVAEKPLVFGVDIVKGSADSGTSPQYALTILHGEDVCQQRVSRYKLFRFIAEREPDMVAVDSYTELASNKKTLVRFLRRMPGRTRLVQVCGLERGSSLPRLASEYGIRINPKNPFDESMACALLARRSVGFEVSPFEDVVEVKVSRARSPGRGGWSQNRYRRRVQGAVRAAVREVEEKISGMDYDLEVQEGFGGLVHGRFTIRAPRRDVPIKPWRSGDVQVTVEARERDALEFIPLKLEGRTPTIVGVDPGTTSGLAVLDLDGRVLEITSKRNASFKTLVEMAGRRGPPLIIACDVFPAPGLAERLKRAYGAELWSPPFEPLSVEEKKELARGHDTDNDHQRDALAAALKAHRSYKNKLEQLGQRAPPWADIDELRVRVVRGQSIEEAIASLTAVGQSEKSHVGGTAARVATSELVEDLRASLREREEQLKTMHAYIEEIKTELEKARQRCDKLSKRMRREVVAELARVKRDREFSVQKSISRRLRRERDAARKEVNRLQETLDELRHVNEMKALEAGRVPVKVMSSFTRKGFDVLVGGLGLKPGDVVYIARTGGGGAAMANRLLETGVSAVISESGFSHLAEKQFFDAGVPFLKDTDVDLQIEGELGHASTEALEFAVKSWQKKAHERRIEEKRRWLDSLVSEYRYERKKDRR